MGSAPEEFAGVGVAYRIVLAAADDEPSIEIATRLGCSRHTVSNWRGRFALRGLDGLHDEPRPSKPARSMVRMSSA